VTLPIVVVEQVVEVQANELAERPETPPRKVRSPPAIGGTPDRRVNDGVSCQQLRESRGRLLLTCVKSSERRSATTRQQQLMSVSMRAAYRKKHRSKYAGSDEGAYDQDDKPHLTPLLLDAARLFCATRFPYTRQVQTTPQCTARRTRLK